LADEEVPLRRAADRVRFAAGGEGTAKHDQQTPITARDAMTFEGTERKPITLDTQNAL
jgi:hypothetical protein